MNKITKAAAGGSVVAGVLLVLAGAAGAQEAFDPTAGVTTLATDGASQVGPIMLAVAGAFLVLLVVSIGIRFVWGMARKNGR